MEQNLYSEVNNGTLNTEQNQRKTNEKIGIRMKKNQMLSIKVYYLYPQPLEETY